MSQSIAPDEADRFAIQFDAPDFDGGSYESVLFAVDVRLQTRDGGADDVGTVVVTYPSIPSPGSFPASSRPEPGRRHAPMFQGQRGRPSAVLASPARSPRA